MPVWEIVVIAVVSMLFGPWILLLISLGGFWLADFFYRFNLAKRCLMTERFVSSPFFGLYSVITGNIGAGKTTMEAALDNMLAKVLQQKASQKVEFVMEVFGDLDFSFVDSIISLAYLDVHISNTDAILHWCTEDSEGEYVDDFVRKERKVLREYLSGRYYYDGLFPVSYTSLFRDYIEARVALIRDNYVFYPLRGFYCWFNDRWAMDASPGMIDIKERRDAADFSIQRYTVITEDEKALSGKVSTNYAQVAKDDGGGKDFLRLIRHFGKGTIYYLCTSQDFTRIVAEERELATGIFRVERRDEVPPIRPDFIVIDLLKAVVSGIYGIRIRMLRKSNAARLISVMKEISVRKDAGLPASKELNDLAQKLSADPLEKPSRMRSFLGRLSRRRSILLSDSFIRYRGRYWTSADDVGKPLNECSSFCTSFDFFFPISWAYGSIDTWQFQVFYDRLSLESIGHQEFHDPKDHFIPTVSEGRMREFVEDYLERRSKTRTMKI